MVNIKSMNKGDTVWIVKQYIGEMLYPIEVEFDSLESPRSNKLAFVIIGGKKICYPTNLLFETKYEAEIYASIAFTKLYYTADPSTVEDIDKEILVDAHKLMSGYEESHPDKFLYHWMNNVPTR